MNFDDALKVLCAADPEDAPANNDPLSRSEILRRYQENIKKSASLRCEILKGAAVEEMPVLFLKAVKAISLMIDEPVFYTQVEEAIKKRPSD